MRSTSDNHPRSALAIRHSTTVLVLETLVRGERFPGSIDPFSELHPCEVASIAAQLKQKTAP